MTFNRSAVPFFKTPAVHKAAEKVGDQNRLVIYCGAGVTIDHTGLDWGGLNSKLFKEGLPGAPTEHEAKELLKYLSPLELSSILETTFTRGNSGKAKAGRAKREDKMKSLLYDQPLWQTGRLARSVIRLSAGYLRRGKQVTIITTNQDVYLEQAFKLYVDELIAMGVPPEFSEHLRVQVLADEDAGLVPLGDSKNPAENCLEIVYLHGRIPEAGEGTTAGFIPNGEADFDRRHEIAATTVKNYLDVPHTGLLVLGSGLRDQPLISGLARTMDKNKDARFAVVPFPGSSFSTEDDKELGRLAGFLKDRGDHLGLTILQPDFHSQVAQFCEEALGSLVAKTRAPSKYSDRLDSWRQGWEKTDTARGPSATYQSLHGALTKARQQLRSVDSGNEKSLTEPMRLELWVRNPKNRTIELRASTAGELRDSAIMRQSDIGLYSANSSVRALVEGRPLLHTFDGLIKSTYSADTGRTSLWKHLLSIPIEVQVENRRMPVGVITLLSQDEMSTIRLADEMSPDVMQTLVKHLKEAGKELLQLPAEPSTETGSIDLKEIESLLSSLKK